MDKKTLVQKYRGAVSVLCGLHNLPSRLAVRSHGRQNRVFAPAALLRHVKIHISGNNNQVLIGDFSRLTDVEIYISGNDNVVQVGAWCTLVKTVFCLEDSGNRITVGEGSRLLGAAELAAIEGTTIQIGKDCLFSGEIFFRTGDSHSLLDASGKRINRSRDIQVADHVWIGRRAAVLKGTRIGQDCVVGACAVVTGDHSAPGCVLAGSPAKAVRNGISWNVRRLPMEPEIT